MSSEYYRDVEFLAWLTFSFSMMNALKWQSLCWDCDYWQQSLCRIVSRSHSCSDFVMISNTDNHHCAELSHHDLVECATDNEHYVELSQRSDSLCVSFNQSRDMLFTTVRVSVVKLKQSFRTIALRKWSKSERRDSVQKQDYTEKTSLDWFKN